MKDAGDSEHVAATGSQISEQYPNTMGELLQLQRQLAVEQLTSWGKKTLAVGAVVVGSGLVAYPVAQELGIEHTKIETDVANAPAEMRFTGNGTSSLQLGGIGNYYVPKGQDGIGVTAEVKDMPSANSGTVGDYFSPQFQNVITNLFHDPERAVGTYTDLLKDEARANVQQYLGIGTLAISGLILAPLALRRDWREAIARHKKAAVAVGMSLTAVGYGASDSYADDLRTDWAKESPSPERSYPIKGLEGTFLEGAVASNQVLQLATNEAVPGFKKNIARQEAATNAFVDAASASIAAQTDGMVGPREGEVADISLADTHGNQAMLRVLELLHDTWVNKWGGDAVQCITVSGDLTTNGTAAEGVFIEDVADIGRGPDDDSEEDDTPIVAITGDHETPVNVDQLLDADMINPDMHIETVGDTTFLGANDTAQKDFGGSKSGKFIGGINEHEQGLLVRELAEEEEPDITLLHQAYAVMSFLGIDESHAVTDEDTMTDFLTDSGPGDRYLTEYRNDGVPNIPTKKLRYGHWHREVPMRVLWNENPITGEITWTTIEEINTATGSVGNPTINRFSLPWYPPLQNSVVRVNFSNPDSGLTTGYQEYTFDTNGNLIISPRVEVGLPGGEPGYARFTKNKDGTLKLSSLVLSDTFRKKS